MAPTQRDLIVRHLGLCPYAETVSSMQRFTARRTAATPDEIWMLEHHPVFTQGRSANPDHVLASGGIPVVNSDRGGNVTYHAPGQITAYLLIDLKRRKIGVRALVEKMENALIRTLEHWQVAAQTQTGAPGVYVDGAKIASLGLRVRRGCCYHGLSLNVDMDLSAWLRINPCGLDVAMTQLRDLVEVKFNQTQVVEVLLEYLCAGLGYTE